MKIEDLIEEIYKSGTTSVQVDNMKAMHGNKNNSGDYSVLILNISGKKYTFSNETGAWIKK